MQGKGFCRIPNMPYVTPWLGPWKGAWFVVGFLMQEQEALEGSREHGHYATAFLFSGGRQKDGWEKTLGMSLHAVIGHFRSLELTTRSFFC